VIKYLEEIPVVTTDKGFSRVSEGQKLILVQKALAECSDRAYTTEKILYLGETQTFPEFVGHTLDCLKYENSYILFVNQDWHGFTGELHPIHQALIASRHTRVVVLEYFNPELQVNARTVPLLGGIAHWLWNRRYYQDSERMRYAKALENACAKHQKPVAVVDIAHNTNYSFNFYLGYLASIVGGIASLLKFIPDHHIALVLAGLFLYHRLDTGIRRVGNRLGKKLSIGGMFNPNHIHWYEKFFLDLEDGRRVLGTCGVRQLVSEYVAKEKEAPNYIVVNVPPAHGIRYAFHLLDPTQADTWARKVKQVIYGLTPNISPTVRTWTYKRGISHASDHTAHGVWILASKRRMKLL
jgi:hypothetical protein